MNQISVEQSDKDKNNFKVTVKDSDSARDFKVQLDDNYFQALVGNKAIVLGASPGERPRARTPREITKEAIIKKSFEFLLARESKEQILQTFHLSEIERYFPDFKKRIML